MSAADLATTGRRWLRRALGLADLRAYDAAAETLAPHLPGYTAVRAVAVNKTPDSNWGVPWHQDRLIAVACRHDLPGFHNWSQKADVCHCEPPLAVLNDMVFARLHLDDTDADAGPMEIALASHRAGAIPAACACTLASQSETESCLAARGDILILHMLTLHRSRPAARATTRRTLRIDHARAPARPAGMGRMMAPQSLAGRP